MSTKKAMVERVASAFLKVSGNKEWFEGADYIAAYGRDRWSEELTIFSPTLNIGRRGKMVEVREYRFENAGTSLPVYTIFHNEPANLAAMNGFIADLREEWADAGREVNVFSRNMKGVDKGLPVPQRVKMPDIEGSDITVGMNSNPLRADSSSADEDARSMYMVTSMEIPWAYRARVNALRGQIELVRSQGDFLKLMHQNEIPVKVYRRMDSQYI